jgi:hypothetical protein
MSQDLKLRHVEVTDAMRDTIIDLLDKIPELRSVGVVLDWSVGQADFPFGMMIGRHGSVRMPGELHGLMLQTAKLSRHQSDVMAEILASADKLAGDISANIAKLREEVRELENKKELILKDQA